MILLKINPCIIRWVSSFLTGRSRVVIDGVSSDLAPVTSRVPQESVLGPTLFVLFINDIVNCVTHSTIRLFADDILVYLPITNPNDHHKLQGDLSRLCRWAKENNMKFNSKKSNVTTFGKKTEHMENVFTYKFGDDTLSRVRVVKYLGILLSADLKWNKHVENAISKAYRVLGLIKLTLGNAPENVKSLTYKTLCRPLL